MTRFRARSEEARHARADRAAVVGALLGTRCPACGAPASCEGFRGDWMTHESLGGEDIETAAYRCRACSHEWSAAEYDNDDEAT